MLSPTDHDLARFIDAITAQIDALALAWIAFAQGRGSAFAELAHVPAPSSRADRHARYSAGVREPAPRRRSTLEERTAREAAAWGWSR